MILLKYLKKLEREHSILWLANKCGYSYTTFYRIFKTGEMTPKQEEKIKLHLGDRIDETQVDWMSVK